MLEYLHKAKEYLWAFVELGFLALLGGLLGLPVGLRRLYRYYGGM